MGVLFGKFSVQSPHRVNSHRRRQLLPKYEKRVPWSHQLKVHYIDWIRREAEAWNFDSSIHGISSNGQHYTVADIYHTSQSISPSTDRSKHTEVLLKERTARESCEYHILDLPYRMKLKSSREAKAESGGGLRPMQVCGFHNNIIVLQALSKDHHLQFIVYDLHHGTFLGKYGIKWTWDSFACECAISPDMAHFLIKPTAFYAAQESGTSAEYPYLKEMRVVHFSNGVCKLEDVIRDVKCARYVVAFDPRYGHSKLALGNWVSSSEASGRDGVCVLDVRRKTPAAISADTNRNHSTKGLVYSPDGSFLASLTVEPCFYQNFYNFPKVLVYDSDTLEVIHSLSCVSTQCVSLYPARLFPAFSRCGTWMVTCYGRDIDILGSVFGQEVAYVEIYKVPIPINLQYLCRIVLRRLLPEITDLSRLPLPKPLINYLAFGPVFA